MTKITFSLSDGRVTSCRPTRAKACAIGFDGAVFGTLLIGDARLAIAGREVRLSPEALPDGICAPLLLTDGGERLALEAIERKGRDLLPARLSDEDLRLLRDKVGALSEEIAALREEIGVLRQKIEGPSIL